MKEYSFNLNERVKPGRVNFFVRNAGRLRHQLRLVRLPAGMPPIGRQLRNPTGTHRVVDTLTILPSTEPGGHAIFAADLTKGRYALICFLEDPGSGSHALKGMAREFFVGEQG